MTLEAGDDILRVAVLAALTAEQPAVDVSRIGVSVTGDCVSLTGQVDSYRQWLAAERAALRVGGVKTVVAGIVVRLAESERRNDGDIARAAVELLHARLAAAADGIRAQVAAGWLTLGGEVDSEQQSRGLGTVLAELAGIRGITNEVRVNAAAPGLASGAGTVAAVSGTERQTAACPAVHRAVPLADAAVEDARP
jgi:osmotically-inducible protein OsmY